MSYQHPMLCRDVSAALQPAVVRLAGSAAAIRASKGLGGFIVQRAHSVEQITTKETQQLQQHIGTVARNSTGCATCPPPTCFKQPIYSPAQQRLWEANAAGCTAAAEAKVFELQPCDATGVLPGLTMNAAAQAGAAEQEEVSAASGEPTSLCIPATGRDI